MIGKLKVLITGGAGVIGSGIIEALGTDSETSIFCQLDGAAISLDNYASSERYDESKKIGGVRYLACDLSKPFRRPDHVDKNDNPVIRRRTGRVFDNRLDCDLGQKANYHNCYCHNYLIKTLKLFKSICLGLSIKQHDYIKHYDYEVQDYFLLIPD